MKDIIFREDYVMPDEGDWFDLSALPESSFRPVEIEVVFVAPTQVDTTQINGGE